MPVIPDAVKQMLDFASFAKSIKDAAKDAGTACDVGECSNLTVGIRCGNCSRRVCVRHGFWNLSGAKATCLCPMCVVASCSDLFADDDEAVG